MARSRSLRRHLSRLLGWARSSAPEPEPARPDSNAMSEELLAALSRWIHGDCVPHATADAEARVALLEGRYGIRIPEDFRRYLVEAAPREETSDHEMTTWWPVDRIRNIPDEYEHEPGPVIAAEAGAFLCFADYLIWCWAWAVCCSDGPNRGRVALIGGSSDGFVADSFTEFAARYLHDPRGMANTQPAGIEADS